MTPYKWTKEGSSRYRSKYFRKDRIIAQVLLVHKTVIIVIALILHETEGIVFKTKTNHGLSFIYSTINTITITDFIKSRLWAGSRVEGCQKERQGSPGAKKR